MPGAEGWWAAVMGPECRPGVLGEGEVTQGQIAATVAELVDEDYRTSQPKAASPLDVLATDTLAAHHAER